MSDQSLADAAAGAVRDALMDLIVSQGGGFVTGFTLMAEVVDSDGERGWLFAQHPDQSPTVTLGQLRFAQISAELDAESYLTEEDE